MPFAIQIKQAFGLAFDIEKTGATKSGFQPAQFDLGAGKELFGDLRLFGFAAALRIGFVERLALMGGDEGRYKGETPVINRAWAIREMLVHDFAIDAERITFHPSRSNTGGNIAIIKEFMLGGLDPLACCVISNHYHLPRVHMDLMAGSLNPHIVPAEAFLLLEDENRKNDLIELLGGGPLAERTAEEIQGSAHKLRGTYAPRTDAPAITVEQQAKCH